MGIGLAVAPRDGETAEEHSHPASELSASRLRVPLAARRASAAPADARSRKAPSTVPIVVVRHLPLDVKCGFDETLPGFSLLDLHLLYVQCLVDLLCPVGEEDGARVADERLRRAVALDGRERTARKELRSCFGQTALARIILL